MSLVRVHSPDTEPELMTLVALLEAHDIHCFVHSAGFGSLLPGPQINGYNTRSIWVPEDEVSAALELLRDFQSQPLDTDPDDTIPRTPASTHTLRAFVELLLFGWFIPGTRHSNSPRESRE